MCPTINYMPQHLLQLSMIDFLLMLQVKLPVVDRIHPQSREFKKTMTATAASLEKRFNEQNDRCACAF